MIITITNNKGGVGKTTTARELLYGLSKAGFKVLGIDLDPQSNLSMLLNADFREKTLSNYISKKIDFEDLIQECAAGDIITSSKDLEIIFNSNITDPAERTYFLVDLLENIKGKYDYIVIDTPPALNDITISSYAASDYLLIPAAADLLSYQGLSNIQQKIINIQKRVNPDLKVMGILINKFKNANLHKFMINDMNKAAETFFNSKVMNTMIRESVVIQDSQFMKKTLENTKKAGNSRSNITNDFEDLVREVLTYEK